MDFEFDLSKSVANKKKHGIDFKTAKALWQDDTRVELRTHFSGEERWMLVGKTNEKHWSAVFTYREDRMRLISVRRSRKEEVVFYEGD